MRDRDTDMPGEMRPSQRCVVYDARSGRVVHIHDIVADGDDIVDGAALREAALDQAPQFRARGYAVAEVPAEMIGKVVSYRVDPATCEVRSLRGGDRSIFRQAGRPEER